MTIRPKTLALLAGLSICVLANPAQAQQIFGEAFYADYSDDRGERAELLLSSKFDLGAADLVVEGRAGRREYGNDVSFDGSSARANLWIDWNDVLATRTILGVSSDDPVYANRRIGQEVLLRPGGGLVLTAGLRHLEYFGDVGVTSYWGGPAFYFDGGFVRYTYTRYDIDDVGETDGHLLTLRIEDRPGSRASTQVWAGTGSSLAEDDFFVGPVIEGDQTGVAIRRVQPVSDTVDLLLGAEYRDYSTDLGDWNRTGVRVGLRVNF
ncbi:YaiO family outer membrane beta-barrel protein [Sphingomicrobium sediminis]|uniref:YaiO family outer membrane beta-barrel protein n=1 Tax=Sphingomicrobium sediminis TaxID=2950949 RepID=A0A9X2EH56_9SPHN|nr:YaiO family outer membrane beta-barrel protein [Sphingomicrobium sediminis]MCM8557465.1 YaiO family outer membrane beta-barrel protein [Sphingomicrobium sediminis]